MTLRPYTPPAMLTVAQAARELGISTKRVRELIEKGKFVVTFQSHTGYMTIPRKAVMARKKLLAVK